ncbi:hypothetical protein, partial [Mesorhizobium sp.]|uniref:hypothetical protein n=1 Tax=Mesorhizobium sp. TaxID=1871066 RepID=UPI0025BEF44F
LTAVIAKVTRDRVQLREPARVCAATTFNPRPSQTSDHEGLLLQWTFHDSGPGRHRQRGCTERGRVAYLNWSFCEKRLRGLQLLP